VKKFSYHDKSLAQGIIAEVCRWAVDERSVSASIPGFLLAFVCLQRATHLNEHFKAILRKIL